MKKFKTNFTSFWKTTKFEFIRLARNKSLLFLLLIFSIILVVLMSNLGSSNSFTIAIFANGKNMDELRVVDIMEEYFDNNNTIIVNSAEEGRELVKKSKARLFIEINVDTTPETAVIYYDSSSGISKSIVGKMGNYQNRFSYETIREFLSEFGIVINEEYFEALSFEPVNETELSSNQISFGTVVTTAIAIVIMFGLSYAISRDNETNVSRNLSYLPISSHKYLLTKMMPYATLGIVELLVLFLLGNWLYGITYQINIFLIFLLSIFFVFACVSLGLLFSLCSSQITSTLLQVLSIVIPLYVLSISYLESAPIIIREVLYLLPTSLFADFLKSMMFNGVVLWGYLIAFVIQIIGYYFISYFIVRRRARQ